MGLTLTKAHELFYEIDGKLYWRKREVTSTWSKVFNVRYADQQAGGFDGRGYRRVRYAHGSPSIGVHRVIFLMHHGYLPEVIDHVNGLPDDNRIQNLRAATHLKNNQNQNRAKHNTSGIKGVSFHKKTGKWRCSLSKNNRVKQVTCFASKDAAAEFMELWREMAHGEFANHGINKEIA
jgi:hypothetical protein